jgi:hypothetical protein
MTDRGNLAQIWGTILAAAMVVPPVLNWTRLTLTRSYRTATGEQRASAADHLAATALRSWKEQARRQGITTTSPVAVRWHAGPADLAPAVPDLCPGTPLTQGVVTAWYDDVYARLGANVLVVLGPPGSGKSGALLLLLLEALRRRNDLPTEARARVPVPVWVTCSSWNPTSTTLPEHVAAVLARDYPGLRSTDHGGRTGPAELIKHAQIAVFLDGMDEMAPGLQAGAVTAITDQGASLTIVLTSRTNEYRTAVAGGGFRPAAVIELCPVDPTAAADFLTARETPARITAWQPILDHLRTHPDSPLSQALATPLGLTLARDTYINRDPTELLDLDQVTRQNVLTSLLGAFLEHAYPNRKEREDALRWLSWIAHQMNTTTATGPTRDLRWWDIPTWIPTWQRRLTTAMAIGPVTGLTYTLAVGRDLGLLGWSAVVLLGGLLGGLVVGRAGSPQRLLLRFPRARDLPSMVKSGILSGSVAGLVTLAFMLAYRLAFWPVGGLVGVLVNEFAGVWVVVPYVGVPVGLVAGLFRLWRTPVDDSPVTTPIDSYKADQRAGLVYGLTVGLAVGVVCGLADELASGLIFGVTVGVVIKLTSGPAPQVRFAQVALGIRGRGRVRFIPLFRDALDKQVLRQAGAVYQFRHAELHDYLAATETTPST